MEAARWTLVASLLPLNMRSIAQSMLRFWQGQGNKWVQQLVQQGGQLQRVQQREQACGVTWLNQTGRHLASLMVERQLWPSRPG